MVRGRWVDWCRRIGASAVASARSIVQVGNSRRCARIAWICIACNYQLSDSPPAGSCQRATLWVAGYAPQLARTGLRIAGDATLILIIAGLSQLWSSLQSRSVLMRSGRMDESAASMYAAAGIAMVGDCIWLVFSPPSGASIDGSLLRLICQALVAVGSMLLTVGLMAILMDVVRLRRVILAMPLSLDQVTQAEGAVDAVPAKPLESRVGGVGGEA